MPVEKHQGTKVSAGTISKNGLLNIAVTGLGRETMLSQIIKLVEQAQGEKVPILEFADKLATYLVPLVLLLAGSVFAAWAVFDHSPDRWMQAVSHLCDRPICAGDGVDPGRAGDVRSPSWFRDRGPGGW